jgi:hypothetical protein
MPATSRIDLLLATLQAADVGSLDSIAEKLRQVEEELRGLGETELAGRAAEALVSLHRGEVAEFQRARAYLQSKIGHLR